MSLDIALLTDIGRKRKNNEDAGIAFHYHTTSLGAGHQIYFLAVADGMGGHLAGEKASEETIRIISTSFVRVFTGLVFDRNLAETLATQITKSIELANNKVYHLSRTVPEYSGMGTTLTVCVIVGYIGVFGNVGDSRAYLIRENKIRRVTKDHSIVQTLLDLGEITEEEAFSHPQRNVITRAVGLKEKVKVDIFQEELRPGDIILLCSDGLHDMLKDNEILFYVLDSKTSRGAAKRLIEMANQCGGDDNITVAVARMIGN